MHYKKLIRITLITSSVIVLLGAGFLYLTSKVFVSEKSRAFERQNLLLYHTDHATIALEARSFANYRRSHYAMPTFLPVQAVSPRDEGVPPSLIELAPLSISVFENRIKLECGGMPLHYGIVIFNEGMEGTGTKELARGVWFYSENGRYPSSEGEQEGPPSTG